MSKVIGLTGGFGTGKTFAASVFRSLGAKVIDADAIARSVTARGRPACGKIAAEFGPAVLDASGAIDRRRLASIVFGDRLALKRLNSIVHPVVIAAIKSELKRAKARDVVVVDAPLLIEAGLGKVADILVVVTAPRNVQIERCMRKFNIDRRQVIGRIAGQMPIGKKADMADYVVDNGGARSVTRNRIRQIWKEIRWR
jgi:dephospho-CoA kinase